MNKCPVCEQKTSTPLPPFCPRCGWDFKNDLTLVTTIGDLPNSVVEEYSQRVNLARKNWKERVEFEKRQKNLEAELQRFKNKDNQKSTQQKKLQTEKQQLARRIEKLAELETRHKKQEQELQRLKAKEQQSSEQIKKLQAERNQIVQQLNSPKKKQDNANKNQNISKKQKTLQAELKKQQALEQENKRLKAKEQQSSEQIKKLQAELTQIDQKLNNTNKKKQYKPRKKQTPVTPPKHATQFTTTSSYISNYEKGCLWKVKIFGASMIFSFVLASMIFLVAGHQREAFPFLWFLIFAVIFFSKFYLF